MGNLISQLMRIPQHENPINTVQDLVEHNITIFEHDLVLDDRRNFYLRANISEWNHVAKTMVPARWDHWGCLKPQQIQICADTNGTWQFYVKHHLHGKKTHAFMKSSLLPHDLEIMPGMKHWLRSARKIWWRSERVLTAAWMPFTASMTSRNWINNEVNCLTLN